MSHFIANSISISKDFKTYKVKGGDNNVIPRSNYWSNELPLAGLYFDLNSGSIDLRSKTEKACFIRQLVNSFDFGGEWKNDTDYYHLHNLPKTKEEISKQIDELTKKTFDNGNEWHKKLLEQQTIIFENFDYYRHKLDDFDNKFMQALINGLKNMPKEKYVLSSNGWNKGYIYKFYKNGASIGGNKNSAMKLGKYRALLEAKRFDNYTIEQV